ncbi:MAG: topoisomerase DNA-binding C4 zinc finger domain-containing protein [Planctomycetota bacterium]
MPIGLKSTEIREVYREQLHAARIRHRAEQLGDDSPKCPNCNGLMSIRTARNGKRSGSQFWGCVKYPNCTGTVPID